MQETSTVPHPITGTISQSSKSTAFAHRTCLVPSSRCPDRPIVRAYLLTFCSCARIACHPLQVLRPCQGNRGLMPGKPTAGIGSTDLRFPPRPMRTDRLATYGAWKPSEYIYLIRYSRSLYIVPPIWPRPCKVAAAPSPVTASTPTHTNPKETQRCLVCNRFLLLPLSA